MLAKCPPRQFYEHSGGQVSNTARQDHAEVENSTFFLDVLAEKAESRSHEARWLSTCLGLDLFAGLFCLLVCMNGADDYKGG